MITNFTCPYCNRPTTITEPNYYRWSRRININNPSNWWKIDDLYFEYEAITCPNLECKKLHLQVSLKESKSTPDGYSYKTLQKRQLLPESEAKVLPDYIPKAIQQDYYEACRIRDLSPKASATLSRRCLQWMIRDFWNIQKKTLKQEIDELQWKVSAKVWKWIDSIRQVWNIWAHMENDINYIIGVEPDEAKLLISLIELLIENWYIKRYEEEISANAVINLAKEKQKTEKNEND